MKKLWKRFGILSVSFCLVLIIAVVGCGTRKANTIKTQTKKDTLISILSEKNIKIDSNYTFDFSTFKIYPIDVSKPMLVRGVVFENAIIEGTNKKESGKLQKIVQDNVQEIKKGSNYTKEKIKETEKSDYTILFVLIALIVVSGIIVYLKLPKIQ